MSADNGTQVPAGPPPPPYKIWLPGEREDFSRGPEILATCGTLVGLALFVVILRLWVRLSFVRKVAWDDYMMIGATAVLIAMMIVIIPEVENGAGRHIEYITPPEKITQGLYFNFITQPLCLVALCLAKVSVGLFLLRVSPSKFFTRFIWGLLIITILSAIAAVLNIMLQCRPLEFTWNKAIDGQCLPTKDLVLSSYFNSAISITTDLIFALLPVPMLWNVQLNWRVKSAIAGILSLGIFTTAAAIVKTTFVGNWGKQGDFLWDTSDITIWYTAEISVAIMAGSIPCLKPLFKKLLASTSARRYGSSGKYANKYGSKGGANGYIRDKGASQGGGTRNRDGDGGAGGARRTKNGEDDFDTFELYTQSGARTRISRSGAPAGAVGKTSTMITTTTKAGSSEESIIIQRPDGVDNGGNMGQAITRTTHIHVSVDEAREKSVRDMV